ncbi:Ff.00g051740.m01.CDS01 [Fusarium sp. VM40]|nr:Ff.00g051740.m01.CDS01 [Fusarium sp. VM40]
MKFTTIITALFTLGFGADMAAAACSGCDMKVCSGKNLSGRCKTGCYPFKKVVAINGEGLNAPVRSGKTDTDCACTLAVESEGSCELINSNRKGTNVNDSACQKPRDVAYCIRQ